MGGAVSSGRDNNELIDNLMTGNYIRTKQVERVLRALDRADYMTPEARDQAYKDLAWRNGPLHLSSPCIYSEVMEGLELKAGLSFLNIGSGTGYLSTMAGLILGTSGISHGVEVHQAVHEYAVKKLGQFIENSPILDDFDFCEPKFYLGNGLCLSPLMSCYDRVYCGAACPEEYENYFKRLIKVGGVLVMPLNDTLQHVRRVADDKWVTRDMLNVSFATLRPPGRDDAAQPLTLDKQAPVRLQLLARAAVRGAMRRGVLRRHPELREAPRAPPPAACPRRICIPIDPAEPVEGLDVLHDLDSENGANEMNALLSLVISMGHNRVAGALRFDRVETSSSEDSSDEENDDDDEEDDDDDDADDDRQPEDARPDVDGPETARPGRATPETCAKDANRPESAKPPKTDAKESPDTEKNNDDKRDTNSDTDDDRPNTRARKNRKALKPSGSRQTRRQKKSRGDDPGEPELPAGCGERLAGRPGEPSTSATGSQSSRSGASLESSLRQSAASSDDNGNCTTQTKGVAASGVPSEVEIDLNTKTAQEASTSQMDWDEVRVEAEGSEDDAEDAKRRAKRQKLDSGIGETTPGGSSPDKSKTESDGERSPGAADEAASRTRGPLSEEEECEELRAHAARRRRRIARGGDARRVRLSLLMKQAVRELPLPHALKKFVNLGRCFEF